MIGTVGFVGGNLQVVLSTHACSLWQWISLSWDSVLATSLPEVARVLLCAAGEARSVEPEVFHQEIVMDWAVSWRGSVTTHMRVCALAFPGVPQDEKEVELWRVLEVTSCTSRVSLVGREDSGRVPGRAVSGFSEWCTSERAAVGCGQPWSGQRPGVRPSMGVIRKSSPLWQQADTVQVQRAALAPLQQVRKKRRCAPGVVHLRSGDVRELTRQGK